MSSGISCSKGTSLVEAHGLCSMWDLPKPGIEPAYPALLGGSPQDHQGNPTERYF